MSSHPNIYIAAVFTTTNGSDINEFLDALEEQEIFFPNGDVYNIVREGNESGVAVDGNSFAICSYATYGWGTTCTPDKITEHVATKTAEANFVVKSFPELTYSIIIGADWF